MCFPFAWVQPWLEAQGELSMGTGARGSSLSP